MKPKAIQQIDMTDKENKKDEPETKISFILKEGEQPSWSGSFSHPIYLEQEVQSFMIPNDITLINLGNKYLQGQGIQDILYDSVRLQESNNEDPLTVTVVPFNSTLKRDQRTSTDQTISRSYFKNLAGFTVFAEENVQGVVQYSVDRESQDKQSQAKKLAQKIHSADRFSIQINPLNQDEVIEFPTNWGNQANYYEAYIYQNNNTIRRKVKAWEQAAMQITGDYLVYEVVVEFEATLTGKLSFRQSGGSEYNNYVDIGKIYQNLAPIMISQKFLVSKVVNVRGTFKNGNQAPENILLYKKKQIK